MRNSAHSISCRPYGARLVLYACVLVVAMGSIVLRAQDRSTYRWYFGYEMGLDFNTLPPTVLHDGKSQHFEGTSVYSDPQTGDLMVYSDGNTIWDRNHDVIAKGINPQYSSSVQSALLVPQPGNPHLIHLFTTPSVCQGPGRHIVIDMRLRGGMGDTMNFNSNLTKLPVAEKLAAVSSSDGIDWWIVYRSCGSTPSKFLVYRLSSSGLSAVPIESQVGQNMSNTTYTIGQMRFSPSGVTLACANEAANVELFDFNRSTGLITNPRILVTNYRAEALGLEFSESGRYLYVASQRIVIDTLQRFDLQASNIQASRQFVAGNSTTFGALLRGRDGKVYASQGSQSYYGAVLNPDAANPVYNEHEVDLSSFAHLPSIGMPNFPLKLPGTGSDPSRVRMPQFACNASDIVVELYSVLGDSVRVQLRFGSGTDSVFVLHGSTLQLTRSVQSPSQLSVRAIFTGLGPNAVTRIDTVYAQCNVYYDCCSNVCRNGTFRAVSAGGQCFPVEYETDLDFRTSNTAQCPYTVDKAGQAVSTSSAHFANAAWSGVSHTQSNDFFFLGETLPSVEQRVWFQRVPTWKDRRYRFQAFACNVEAKPRFDTTGMSLDLTLEIVQNGVARRVAQRNGLRFSDAWQEVSGEYVSTGDGDVEVRVLVKCTSSQTHSFGFGIDDISFEPLQEVFPFAGSDTTLCVGATLQLNAQAPGAAAVEWTPSTGLSDAHILNPTVVIQKATTYVLRASDRNGCSVVDSIVLQALEPERVTLRCDKRKLCSPDWTVVRLIGAGQVVRWSDGSSADTLRIESPGTYYALVRTASGCLVSTDTVAVDAESAITVQPTLHIPETVRAGNYGILNIQLDSFSTSLLGAEYTLYLRFRSTVFYPYQQSSVVIGADGWTRLRVNSIIRDSVLDRVVLLALLGAERSSEIIVDSIVIQTPCAYTVTTTPTKCSIEACWIGEGIVSLANSVVVSVNPQPADNEIQLRWSSMQPGTLYYSLSDVSGRECRSGSISLEAAREGQSCITSATLSSGMYMLRLFDGSQLRSMSVMIVH